MSKKSTTKKTPKKGTATGGKGKGPPARKVRDIPKGTKKLGDIVSARQLVAGAAIKLASAKTGHKEATEAYNSALGRLLRVIDNNEDLPLFDQGDKPKAKSPAQKIADQAKTASGKKKESKKAPKKTPSKTTASARAGR